MLERTLVVFAVAEAHQNRTVVNILDPLAEVEANQNRMIVKNLAIIVLRFEQVARDLHL